MLRAELSGAYGSATEAGATPSVGGISYGLTSI